MEKTSSFLWLIRLTNLLLLLLCGFVLVKLAPIWRPLLDLFIQVLLPFLFAGLITYLLHPVIEQLHHLGLPRPLAVLLIYVVFFGGIGYLLVLGTPYLIAQLKDFAENVPRFSEQFRGWLAFVQQRMDNMPEGVHQYIEGWLHEFERYIDQVIANILETLKDMVHSLIYFIVIPFLVFYLLKDFQLVEKVAWYVTPKQWRKDSIALVRDIDKSFGRFIRGQLLVSLTVGLLATIGLWFIGVPYPILLGLFIGATDIIPYFGAFLGAAPALVMAGLHSLHLLAYTVVLIFVLQQIEGNILSPVIVGKTLHMHPILIMLALLTGFELAGVFGLILAVPTLAVVKVVFVHVRLNVMKD